MQKLALRSFLLNFIILFICTILPLPGIQARQAMAEQAASTSAADFEYTIGLGDSIEVIVWKEPDLTKMYTVRIDGRISIPLVGDVVVAGKSIRELTEYLNKRFSEVITEPAVSVILSKSQSWRYYVIGQINKPGEYALDYPVTMLQAIARAGGFQEWAKTSEIRVVRQVDGKETMIGFDYDALVKRNDLSQNIPIVPGDTLIIP